MVKNDKKVRNKASEIKRNEKERLDYGQELIGWSIPEYEKHDRDTAWYVIVGVISFFMLIFAFWTDNFLFAVIIVIALFIIILHHGADNILDVEFKITTDGVLIGKKFFDYRDIKHFSIVYQPKDGIKRLYFEFNQMLKYRLSVPLQDKDPLIIRDILLKYLLEDIERENEPLSENLSRFLKL